MKNKTVELSSELLLELSAWNDEKAAFIKHDMYDGKMMWMVFDADGERIAATDDRDFAFVVAKQNNLTPYSAH